ncbi:hypothetical protein ACQ4PT_060386 [Festuca glaucescens]
MALAMFMDCAEILSNINACREFFSWTASSIRAASCNSNVAQLPDEDEIEKLDTKLGQLKNCLWKLKTTMPKMFDLIDRTEWQSHKKQTADLLPDIKDAVYDAEDLLDEFDYYTLKLKVEWSKSSGQDHLRDTFLEFLESVGSNDYIAKVDEIQAKLDHVHGQSMAMGLHQALQKFDKSVRPETSSFFREPKIFGREKELKQLVETLGVRGAGKRGRTESDVVPIVGMGGVGKTTMAQQICNDAKVKGHFDRIVWTCVSDDFDTKRLTKEIIEHLGGNTSASDNLDCLMRKLEDTVQSKRFLLVLDDIWDDVLEQDGARWNLFCQPLRNGAEGSMILVTTRSPEVANLVGPMNHYELKGLQDAIFWDFFKLCAFGSMSSCNNQESLECIGKNIVTKLKGSPLAAKTIGRLLRMELSTSHWENILQSELWRLEQTETDILPALRLSYMYLPQKLKRCFSICAMYPKDHKFEKGFLADIWVAQGYVADPQEASQCFDGLANRSFFQKASPQSDKYVIHDLMHDTAKLVSKDECFTIKLVSDIDKVPSNVRHLSIFANGNVECSELKRICQKKKLRSLVCDESYSRVKDFAPLIDCWFKELLKIRVLRFKVCNVKQLPESMGSSKHLRYLCLLGGSKFGTLPSSVFCHLYHLKIIERVNSEFEKIPLGFSDAISFQKIKSKSFSYNKDPYDKLFLEWSNRVPSQEMMDNQMEVIPHWNLQHLKLLGYEGECCPSWFRPNLMQRLCSLEFHQCDKFKTVPFFGPLEGSLDNSAGSDNHNCPEELVRFSSLTRIDIGWCRSLTSIPLDVWSSNLPSLKELHISYCKSLASIGGCGANISSSSGSGVKGFSSLAKIRIWMCEKLLSLDEFMTPAYLPVVKAVSVSTCEELTSLSVDRLDGLQDLEISSCPKLNLHRVMTFPSSLKKLDLNYCKGIESININNSQSRSSSELEHLRISQCPGLKSIGGATAIDEIIYVYISGSPELKEIQQPLNRGYVQ